MFSTQSSHSAQCGAKRGWCTVKVVECTVSVLNERLARMHPGSYLPSDAALASELAVSVATVRRAMRRLSDSGAVVRVHGKGTAKPGRMVSLGTEEESDGSRVDAVQTIVDALKGCIGRGELRRGDPLPAYKNLCGGFGVSATTVYRALCALVKVGLVCKVGRSYRVGRFLDIARVPVHKEVVFLCPPELDLERLFTTHEIALSFHKLESELLAHGHTLRYAGYEELPSMVTAWIEAGHFPQGLVLSGPHAGGVNADLFDDLRYDLNRLMAAARTLRPTALALTTSFVEKHPFVRFFSISHATTMMMRRLSRMLFEQSLDSATFFFDVDGDRVGLFQDMLRLLPEIDYLCPGFALRHALVAVKKRGFLSGWHKAYSVEHLQSRASKYRPVSPDEIRSSIVGYPTWDTACAASASSRTWIFWRDEAAVSAMEWCRKAGKRIPHDISIVSLENNRKYYRHGITACVRDWETMGYLMAHALIGDIPLQYTRRGFIQCDALLLQRQTTPR